MLTFFNQFCLGLDNETIIGKDLLMNHIYSTFVVFLQFIAQEIICQSCSFGEINNMI